MHLHHFIQWQGCLTFSTSVYPQTVPSKKSTKLDIRQVENLLVLVLVLKALVFLYIVLGYPLHALVSRPTRKQTCSTMLTSDLTGRATGSLKQYAHIWSMVKCQFSQNMAMYRLPVQVPVTSTSLKSQPA